MQVAETSADICAPFPGTEFDLTEFLHRETTPNAGPFRVTGKLL